MAVCGRVLSCRLSIALKSEVAWFTLSLCIVFFPQTLRAFPAGRPRTNSGAARVDIDSDPAYSPSTNRLGVLGVFSSMADLEVSFRSLIESMFMAFPTVTPGLHHVHVVHVALLQSPLPLVGYVQSRCCRSLVRSQ